MNNHTGQPTEAPLAIPSHYSPIPTGTYAQEATMSAYPQTFAPSTPAAAMPAPTDPGRTLGIVGLVLSFVANVVGLVVSVLAYRKSKQAGYKNGVALAGVIIGALSTIGLLTAGIVGGLAAKSLVDTCNDLGPGQHVVNGVTYTCG